MAGPRALIAGAALFGTTLAILLAWALLGHLIPAAPHLDPAAIRKVFAAQPEQFQPEPLERARYLAALALLPVGLLTGCWAAVHWRDRLAGRGAWLAGAGAVALLAVTAGAFAHAAPLLTRSPVSLVLVIPVAGAFWYWRAERDVREPLLALCLAYTVLVSARCVFTENRLVENGTWELTFNAVFHSVAQVVNGKELLVDLISQYGQFPQFLEPFMRLFGPSVLTFTALMAAALLVGNLALLWVSFHAIRSPLLAAACYLTILYADKPFSGTIDPTDAYFQYGPIRTLFPSLLLAGATWYFGDRRQGVRRALFWGLSALAANAAIWNLDTGLVVLVAWAAAVVYDDLLHRQPLVKPLGHLLAIGAVTGSAVAAFWAYLGLRYGTFPDLAAGMVYQKVFYVTGFFMLPMPPVHPWNLMALVYGAGLAYAVQALVRGEGDTQRSSFACLVSLLGLGLFSYYQGRSHDWNLMHVLYPAVLLVAFCMESIGQIPVATRLGKAARALPIALGALALAHGSLSALAETRHEVASARDNFRAWKPNPDSRIGPNARFLATWARPGEPALILSYQSGVYYLDSRTVCPIRVPGPSELLLQADWDKMVSWIDRGGGKVFLDSDMDPLADGNALRNLRAHLRARYRQVAAGPGGFMTFWQPR